VRRLSKSLNTDRFAQRSLGQVIAEECQRVQLHTNVQVHFHQAGDEQPLASDSKLILFRLFQEALNNALKHAQATSINVYLQQQPAPAITYATMAAVSTPRTMAMARAWRTCNGAPR
jgi:signal transduction histidine kinase